MKRGLLHVLARSAELLERHAEELRAAHTIGSRWPKEDEHAHRDFKELRAMAKALRKARKYHSPNPLGGPATMFDAIADRMRAGDSMERCMADHGLKFKKG